MITLVKGVLGGAAAIGAGATVGSAMNTLNAASNAGKIMKVCQTLGTIGLSVAVGELASSGIQNTVDTVVTVSNVVVDKTKTCIVNF